MITMIQQNQLLRREAIAELACQLWRAEGRPRGRDQEYWLRAERRLRELTRSINNQTGGPALKRIKIRCMASQNPIDHLASAAMPGSSELQNGTGEN